MHLLMDGFGGDEEKLKSEDFVHGFLDKLPDEIGMTKINGPHVMTYNGPKEEDWGVSGFVMIAESHISVHTFPDRSYVNIDVFSCKDFDHEQVLARVKELFGLDQVKLWVIGRGLDYSRPNFRSPVRRGQAKAELSGVV
jgi:S-adenosylmethionine decarboxylase